MHSIKNIIGIITALMLTNCWAHSVDTQNGSSSGFTTFIGGYQKTSTTDQFDKCLERISSFQKNGKQTMTYAQAEMHCQHPTWWPTPLICGQNVECPAGVPDGVQKFEGMPMGGQYMMMNGGYYGTVPYNSINQPSGPHTPATGGYHSGLTQRGTVVGYAGDATYVGTPAHLVTEFEHQRDINNLQKNDDALAEELVTQAKRKTESAPPPSEEPAKPTAK
jgi:hypothetical protein